MKFKWVICSILLIGSLLAVTGCTSSSPPTTTTPIPTPVQTQVGPTSLPTMTSGGSTKPVPTDALRSEKPVVFSIEKAGTYSTTIITTFEGGMGMSAVSKIDVRVTRPDGSVVTGVVIPKKGETLELEGTNGTDRVEVFVMYNTGYTYRVRDEQMPYKTRG